MHIKNPPPWKSYTVAKTNYQRVDTIMIFNLNNEHAWSYEIDPLLASLFRYIDSLSLPETPYVTGRPPVSKKSLLKCFFLKTYFSIDSLRKLVRILQRFRCFQRACGFSKVSHLSTFFRAAKWFREQGFPVFLCTAAQRFRSTVSPIVLIDSTALEAVFTIHRQSGECLPNTTG
jgi:hypothetical protein